MNVQSHLLKQALQILLPISQQRTSLPILKTTRMEKVDNHLFLQATDLDNTIQIRIPVETSKEEKFKTFCVNILQLQQLTEALQNEPYIYLNGGSLLKVSDSKRHALLSTYNEMELPQLSFQALSGPNTYPSKEFLNTLKNVKTFSSQDSSRYVINSVQFNTHNNQDVLVATDGKRLQITPLPAPISKNQEVKGLLPTGNIKLLLKILEELPQGKISIDFQTQNPKGFFANVQSEGIEINLKLDKIDGTYPNWKTKDVLPETSSQKATYTFKRDDLKEILQTAAKLQLKLSTLNFNKEKVEILSEDRKSNQLTSSIPLIQSQSNGFLPIRPENHIKVNTQYLLEGISAQDEIVRLHFYGKDKKISLESTPEYGFQVLMPMV